MPWRSSAGRTTGDCLLEMRLPALRKAGFSRSTGIAMTRFGEGALEGVKRKHRGDIEETSWERLGNVQFLYGGLGGGMDSLIG